MDNIFNHNMDNDFEEEGVVVSQSEITGNLLDDGAGVTGDVTEGVAPHVTEDVTPMPQVENQAGEEHALTLEEVKLWSDEQLLAMLEKAKGNTKDFQRITNVGFSYSSLCGILRERGYVNGWHKPDGGQKNEAAPIQEPAAPKIIKMEPFCEKEDNRLYLTVCKSLADEWKYFTSFYKYPRVINEWALRYFMEEVESGRVKITYDF